MADITVALDPVNAPVEAICRATVASPALTDPDLLSRLRPIRATVVQLDEFRTRLGWPVEVPRADSRTTSLASANGETISRRPEPSEIATGATARWIADEDTFDDVAHVWRPSGGPETGFRWITQEAYAPTLIKKMPYYVGKELFVRDAINFDASNSQHMWSRFTGGLVGTTGYTVIIAGMLNSALGNTEGRQFSGIWAPGGEYSPTEAAEHEGFSVLLENNLIVVDSEAGENHTGLFATEMLSASRVVYLAFSLEYPVSTVWGSFGVGKTTQRSTLVGHDIYSQQMQVLLGRSLGSLVNTADMAIMDLGIYADVLGFNDVEREISILAQSYGG